MEFLFRSSKWSNVEWGLIKAFTSSGIVLGVLFYDQLKSFLPYFFASFFIFGQIKTPENEF